MKEYKEGKLKSSSGDKVKGRKQAVAIALSEAREAGAKIPPKGAAKKKASAKQTSRKATPSSGKRTAKKKGTSRKGTAKKAARKSS